MVDRRPLTSKQTLEARIAACLSNNGDGVSASTALQDLIQELETEIVAADAAAKVAHEHALDPSVLDDEADDAARTAERRALRLHKAVEPLRGRYAAALAQEAAADWGHEHIRLEKLFEAAIEQLAAHPQLTNAMVEIFTTVENLEQQISAHNMRAPAGEMRRLRFSTSVKSILAKTVLLDCNGEQLWPTKRGNGFAGMFDDSNAFLPPPPSENPDAFGPNWWRAGQQKRDADAAVAAEQVEKDEAARIEFYKGR